MIEATRLARRACNRSTNFAYHSEKLTLSELSCIERLAQAMNIDLDKEAAHLSEEMDLSAKQWIESIDDLLAALQFASSPKPSSACA